MVYSSASISYPLNNLLVAFCSASPVLVGVAYSSRFGLKSLLLFAIVFGTVAISEVIKDIADIEVDKGCKDTFATRVGKFQAGLHAARLGYPLCMIACIYPNLLVRITGTIFPVATVMLWVFCSRFRSTYWAEKVGDLFLVIIIAVLLCT